MNKPYLQMLNTLAVAAKPSAPPVYPDYPWISPQTVDQAGEPAGIGVSLLKASGYSLECCLKTAGSNPPTADDPGWTDVATSEILSNRAELAAGDRMYFRRSISGSGITSYFGDQLFNGVQSRSSYYTEGIFGLISDMDWEIGGDVAYLMAADPSSVPQETALCIGYMLTNNSTRPNVVTHGDVKLGFPYIPADFFCETTSDMSPFCLVGTKLSSLEVMATDAAAAVPSSGITLGKYGLFGMGGYVTGQQPPCGDYSTLKLHLPAPLKNGTDVYFPLTSGAFSPFSTNLTDFWCPKSYVDVTDAAAVSAARTAGYIPSDTNCVLHNYEE